MQQPITSHEWIEPIVIGVSHEELPSVFHIAPNDWKEERSRRKGVNSCLPHFPPPSLPLPPHSLHTSVVKFSFLETNIWKHVEQCFRQRAIVVQHHSTCSLQNGDKIVGRCRENENERRGGERGRGGERRKEEERKGKERYLCRNNFFFRLLVPIIWYKWIKSVLCRKVYEEVPSMPNILFQISNKNK